MNMRGDTLIEVLVALTIAVVVISALSFLGVSSLSNAQFVREQTQAAKYAQEGIEQVRKIRNSNYVGFRSFSGLYCLANGQATLGSVSTSCATTNINGKYVRSVQVQQNGGCGVNLVNIAVVVAWSDNKCSSGTFCHSSRLTSCLSTVPLVPAP